MRNFVTSDPHGGHGKICIYARRYEFMTTEEIALCKLTPDNELRSLNVSEETIVRMNEGLISRWNARVKSEDTVFINGDVYFKSGGGKAQEWLDKLNGNKIIVRGNHDNQNSVKTIIDCIHLTYGGQRINMVHKPEHANPDFGVNFIGHVHKAWKIRTFKEHYGVIENIVKNNAGLDKEKPELVKFLDEHQSNRNSDSVLLNVGVDVQNYMPITFDEALGQVVRFKKGLSEN